MCGYEVHLFAENGLDKRIIRDAAKWFEKISGPVKVIPSTDTIVLESNTDGELTWAGVLDALQKIRIDKAIDAASFVYLLTKTPNEMNWFAAADETNMRNAFGHIEDFSWCTTAPSHVIAAHYITKTIFNALLTDKEPDWEKYWHRQARGCFFDFCGNKADLHIKLRTADICRDCMQVFQSIGIPDGLLRQTILIMEASRKYAINTSEYLPSEESFHRWPYPVAITRHKVIQAHNPVLKFLLLLDHFDSLVRYFYLAHEVLAGRQPLIDDRPSLGWWVDKLAKCLKGEKNYREVVEIADRKKVVKLRNEKRGHGWMSELEEEYHIDAESLQKTMNSIEDELASFLESYHLVVPRYSDFRNSRLIIEGDHLHGSHQMHPPFVMETTESLQSLGFRDSNLVYITDAKMKEFTCMDPYIKSSMCPKCDHQRILITDGGNVYIDVQMGHRVTLE